MNAGELQSVPSSSGLGFMGRTGKSRAEERNQEPNNEEPYKPY